MALPPLWKVRREILRSYTKIAIPTSRWFYEPVRKVAYDLTARWQQRLTPGAFSLTDRVAVFVVFQPMGIPASVMLTLDHLRQNGFSVFVVSNGPLRPKDCATLSGSCSLIMERPNVGYDFGAYRDGIRHLWSLNRQLSRLLLMNDSTWFPLRSDDDSLDRMEALGADLAAHIYKIEDEAVRRRDHVESHLLMISLEFLQSDEFRRFWSDYRMSNFRSTTIEFGEKGLTQMAIRSGRKVAALMHREWLISTLDSLDDCELRLVLDHLIDDLRFRDKGPGAVQSAAARGAPWREDFLAWVNWEISNSLIFLISPTFVMPALVYGQMGFAKKSKELRFPSGAAKAFGFRIQRHDPTH